MLRKNYCLPVNANFVLVCYIFFDKRNWIRVMSDVTLHVNMIPLKVEDRLLIKTLQTEKSWIVKK